MKELITITFVNSQVKQIERDYNFKTNVPAMVILSELNKQGHGVKSVVITLI